MIPLITAVTIAAPWGLLFAKRALDGRLALPSPKLTVGVETVDLGRVLRLGTLLFGVSYFAIWAAVDVVSTGWNPLYWYAWLYLFSGHWLTWVSLWAIVVFRGRASIVTGLASAGYLYAWHEGLWVSIMTVYHAMRFGPTLYVLTIYDYLGVLLMGCLALYFVAFRALPGRTEVVVVASLLAFDAAWVLMGFHVTYDQMVPGFATVWVNNPGVNLTEVLGWVLPGLPIYFVKGRR